MGEMRIMSPEDGDSKSMWDPDNKDECEAAEELFNELVDKGFTAYRVKKDGEKSTQKLKTFDPSAGKMILVPRIAGG